MKNEELRIELKERGSLTILYSIIVFCILLISLLMSVIIAILLSTLGVLSFSDSSFSPFIFMALVSAAVGLLLTLLTRKVPLSPINNLINSMNRLKSGDFKARLEFDGKLRNHPIALELKDSFNTMAQELENTEKLRNNFINNFSHEFKTPIVSIAGFAKLLRRSNLSKDQQEEYLKIIEDESLRLSNMATKVLSLSKIENQTILTDVRRFNLSEQIRSCILLLEDMWSKKNITLNPDFDEHYISANEELLKQVWINLLDNAIKFSPPKGEIDIGIKTADSSTIVSITNYGDDIPGEKLNLIWNKFYQADESHASKGNGIGLAIVKAIVTLHKGKCRVTSAEGRTCFEVELPSAANFM